MLIARRVVIFAGLWLFFEVVISLLATCDQVAEHASQRGGSEQAQKHCSALTGPILASGWAFLYWLGHILEGYGEAVIAVFTIVLAFATGLLWKATRDLVRGSEQTAERQLRAYLYPSEGKIIEVNGVNGPGVTIKFKNYGQTPAHDVSFVWAIGYGPYPIDWSVISEPKDMVKPQYPVPPQRESKAIPNYLMRRLSPDQMVRLDAGTSAIYVIGEIKYRDVFGVSRISKVRLYRIGPINLAESDGLDFWPDGNEAT
ncbi:MAG: hypothetical protein QOF14_988 [Hyphomicrobiales bacterium]|nr:hypothetical protein [Hyphomicrobiales bacterium]